MQSQGDSGSEPDDADEPEQLEQEMGDVGAGGDVVDERLWGQDDKPEPGQAPGEEKYERDAPVQARAPRAPRTPFGDLLLYCPHVHLAAWLVRMTNHLVTAGHFICSHLVIF